MKDLDVLIIGGGFAGVLTAIHLRGLRVAIVHPDLLGRATSSIRAKGGLAAAVAPGDSVDSHARDTLIAGAGHGDPAIVRTITSRGPIAVRKLTEYGVPFERDDLGDFVLKHEAAHATARVLSVSDSRTGRAIMHTLLERLAEMDVRKLEGWTATRLLSFDHEVRGGLFECGDVAMTLQARATVLATGGACGLWKTSSVPALACGEGIGMAHAVGARLRDLEFVQFHPTAAEVDGKVVLLTEALRGAGAVLVDRDGRRIMAGEHPALDLAPRDTVARKVEAIRREGGDVFLDIAAVARLENRFPEVHEVALRTGSSKIPIRACAHYHMGGIATDLEGRTSVEGLWAVGEVASTGLHGANRLASNSLLEIAVTAPAAAAAIRRDIATRSRPAVSQGVQPFFRRPDEPPRDAKLDLVRALMDEHLGPHRTTDGIRLAIRELSNLPRTHAVTAALLIAGAALRRENSLGSHFIE